MLNLAGLRNFAESDERASLNYDLSRGTALDEDDTDVLDRPSKIDKTIEKSFYTRIEEFTNHLDQITRLAVKESSNESILGEQISAEASAMQKSLYQARLLLHHFKFNKRDYRSMLILETYQAAQRCYYEKIRPNVLSMEDLDIPHLDLSFRIEKGKNGKKQLDIIQPIEFVEGYRQVLAVSLRELLGLAPEEPNLDSDQLACKSKIDQELIALTKSLVEEAKTLIPPRTFPSYQNNLPEGFEDFAKELNDCLLCFLGDPEDKILYKDEDLHQAIYSSPDCYEAITGSLIDITASSADSRVQLKLTK